MNFIWTIWRKKCDAALIYADPYSKMNDSWVYVRSLCLQFSNYFTAALSILSVIYWAFLFGDMWACYWQNYMLFSNKEFSFSLWKASVEFFLSSYIWPCCPFCFVECNALVKHTYNWGPLQPVAYWSCVMALQCQHGDHIARCNVTSIQSTNQTWDPCIRYVSEERS